MRQRKGASVNIEYLHYFLDVAKTNSITRAAKLNFISPQGMSRAMNELEKELGCQLLIRYSNKLGISPVGQALISRASDIVERYNGLLEFAAEQSQMQHEKKEGSLQLECQNVAMLAFLTQEAKEFIFSCHDIHFRESQNAQIRHSLLSRTLNQTPESMPVIGLVCFFNQERSTDFGGIEDLEEKGYQYRPYLKTFDRVMVSANSKLAEKDTVSDEEIVEKTLACTNSYLYDILSRRFGRDAIVLSSPDFSLRKRLVVRDSAVSFLPAIASLTLSGEQDFVLRAMDHPYEVEIGFIGMEDDFNLPCFEKLLETLDEFYRAHEDSGLYTLCK